MSMKFRMLALATASLVALGAPAAAQVAKPVYGDWGYNSAAMDSSVKPGDDFFAYVNGSWYKTAQIASDRTFVGIDSVLNDQIDKDVRDLIENAAKNPAQYGATGQQIGDFYASWMDQPAIEARGLDPAKPYLARIDAVSTRGQLEDLFATVGYQAPIGIGIYPDPKAPSRYAVGADQSGLGMRPRLLPSHRRQVRRIPHRLPQLYRADADTCRRVRSPRAAPTASWRSKPRWRSPTGLRSAAATSRRPTTR